VKNTLFEKNYLKKQGIIWGKFPTSTVKDLTSFPTLSLDFQLFHFFRTPHTKKWQFFAPLKPKQDGLRHNQTSKSRLG